jgi:cyclophilin family peptidyl-prolyl cis-trans isomerase
VKIEQLEGRRLLSAALTAALQDVNSSTQFVALGEHFKDTNTFVRLTMSNGASLGTQTIDLKLYDSNTPQTVQNFLNYVNSGAYDGAFFYRSVPGFIIQAGAFNASDPLDQITTDATTPNEFSTDVRQNGEVNVRGTIAMAKVPPQNEEMDQSGNPVIGADGNPIFDTVAHGGADSASADFFLNLGDNASNLDNQNSGFTTFGEVVGNSITTMDAIGNLPEFNVSGTPFQNLPVVNYTTGSIGVDNLVIISTARVLPLTYTAVSDNSSLVSVNTSGSTLLLTYPGVGTTGTAHITVTATSFDGTTSQSTFAVTVPATVPPDTAPPTAVASAPELKADNSTFTFHVAYHDNQALNVTTLGNTDLTVTGPGGFSQAATFVAAAPQASGETLATYQITPSAAFVHSQSGNFVVNVNSGEIADAAGNMLASGSIGTLKLSFPDLVTPTVAAVSPLTIGSGNNSFTFTVTYHDDVAIRPETISARNVQVTGPNSFSAVGDATAAPAVALAGTTTQPNGDIVATYRVTPTPGGPFTGANNGTYTVSMLATQVGDTSGNIVAAGSIGALTLDVTPPTAIASNLRVAAGNGSFTFDVIYTDNFGIDTTKLDSNDITVKGPKNFSAAAQFLSFVPGAAGSDVATYKITAPLGTFAANQSGLFSINVNANQVTDTSALPVATGRIGLLIGNFPTGTGPTATASVGAISANNDSFTIIVNYHSDTGLNISTLGDDDLTITDGNSFTASATLLEANQINGNVDVQAIYKVKPASPFIPQQSGVYYFQLNENKIADTNAVPADPLVVGSQNLLFPDIIAPTATVGAATVASGNGSFSFSVNYRDNVAIDTSTIGSDDIAIVSPGGNITAVAEFVSMTGSGTSVVATYKLDATDNGQFIPSQGGTFSVAVLANSVKDTAGNPVAGGLAGTFLLTIPDIFPPAATAGAGTIESGNASFTFVAIYHDETAIDTTSINSNDLTVTGPGGFSANATVVLILPPDGTGNVSAEYRVNGPPGGFTAGMSGNYIVSAQSGQIFDTSHNPVAAGPIGTLSLNFGDITAPTATASGATIPAGSISFSFNVAYHDDVAIDATTIDNSDLTVTGPGGFSGSAHLVSTSGSGTDILATYRVDAASAFFPANSGTYIVAMNAGQVTDTSQNPVAATAIGTLSLTFPTLAPKPDLMGTFKSVTPASLAGGSKGSATITVRNGGTLALAATKVTITLYASTASDGSHSGPAIGTFSGIIKLAARASMNVPIAFTAPKNLADANYHIVAVLDSANKVKELNEVNNTIASTQTVHIAPPAVDLKVALLGRISGVTAKKANSVSLLLSNSGNIPAAGNATIRFYESPDTLGTNKRLLVSLPKTINIAPGKSVALPLKFTPAAVAAGKEFLLASVVYNGKPADKNPADNSVFSTTVVLFK